MSKSFDNEDKFTFEGRGNHFGCTSEGQASVGVFGMMSSVILSMQVFFLLEVGRCSVIVHKTTFYLSINQTEVCAAIFDF